MLLKINKSRLGSMDEIKDLMITVYVSKGVGFIPDYVIRSLIFPKGVTNRYDRLKACFPHLTETSLHKRGVVLTEDILGPNTVIHNGRRYTDYADDIVREVEPFKVGDVFVTEEIEDEHLIGYRIPREMIHEIVE